MSGLTSRLGLWGPREDILKVYVRIRTIGEEFQDAYRRVEAGASYVHGYKVLYNSYCIDQDIQGGRRGLS